VLAFMAIATVGMRLQPVDAATLQAHGIQPWTLYYGPITASVESVALIALAVGLLRRRAGARTALLFLLPVTITHSIAYSFWVVGLPLQGALFSASLDTLAWLALLVDLLLRARQSAIRDQV
jgi:hypothetical protein